MFGCADRKFFGAIPRAPVSFPAVISFPAGMHAGRIAPSPQSNPARSGLRRKKLQQTSTYELPLVGRKVLKRFEGFDKGFTRESPTGWGEQKLLQTYTPGEFVSTAATNEKYRQTCIPKREHRREMGLTWAY